MARYRQLKTLDDYGRAIRNGYGVGSSECYKPWLRVQDVKSKGLSEKVFGIKTGRVHHLLSQGESEFFRLSEFSERVVDIREQFPLLPLKLAKRIAETLGIKYPIVPGTDIDHIITTDFLLTLRNRDGISYRAVSVKTPKDLLKARTLEKQEIERVWWQLLGVPFSIFCSNERTKQQAANIDHFSGPARRGVVVDAEVLEDTLSCLDVGFQSWSGCIERMASKQGIDAGQAIDLLSQLIWSQQLIIDLDKRILEEDLLKIRRIRTKRISNAS